MKYQLRVKHGGELSESKIWIKIQAPKSFFSGFVVCRSEFQNDMFVFLGIFSSLYCLICSVSCLAYLKGVKMQPNSKHVTQASRRTKDEQRQSKGHHVTTQGKRSL